MERENVRGGAIIIIVITKVKITVISVSVYGLIT